MDNFYQLQINHIQVELRQAKTHCAPERGTVNPDKKLRFN